MTPLRRSVNQFLRTLSPEPPPGPAASNLQEEVHEQIRYPLIKAIAASGLLLLGSTATAQYRPRIEYQTEREAQEHDRLFDRVRGDLDRAHASTLPFTADRDRVVLAQSELSRCQRALAAGDYDRSEFDEAVVAIQRVTDLNQLSERTRDYLRDDARDLRQLQERLER